MPGFAMFPTKRRTGTDRNLGDAELALCLDRALNNISQGLCFFDGSHRLIVCNNRYTEMYGLSAERVRPGISLREIVDLRIAAGTGPAMSREEYLTWRDAVAVSDIATDTTVTLQNGRIISVRHRPMPDRGWVATHEDITRPQRRENSFRLLFNSNPVPMWVVDPSTLRFLDVNEAALAHYGYARGDFLNMTALDLRFPDDVQTFRRYVLTGDKTQGTRIWRHRKADGSAILVSVYAEDLDYEGRRGRLCAAVDITDRKRSEEKLLEQKLQIDTAIENISQGLLMFDAEGRIVLFNRRYLEMYNLSAEVVKPGCTLRELIGHRRQAGTFSGDPDAYCQGVLEGIRNGVTMARP